MTTNSPMDVVTTGKRPLLDLFNFEPSYKKQNTELAQTDLIRIEASKVAPSFTLEIFFTLKLI